MKVLQINSVCGVGSTGRIATDIHNILLEQGHDSFIAYGRDLPMNCDSSIRIGTKYDNYGHVALTRVFDKHGFGSKKATQDFITEVEKLDPDIIHLHNLHGYYINIEILFEYLKQANKPVVWTLHDCWAFTGHCSHFDFIGCNRWKTGCHDCPQTKNYPSSYIIDNSKSNYLMKKEIFTGIKNMTIVTPSKWLAELVKESLLREYPVKVINNGINLDVFKPTKSNFREINHLNNKYVILGVASVWDKRKGYEYFIELSKQIKEDVSIVLVGLTDKQIKELPKNIMGIAKTNNIIELAEIYSAADVFINPTLEDNFPTTNLEALACGTPVITFNTGGSVESIDESCGIVVSKENVNELLNAIQNIRYNFKDRTACVNRSKLYDKNDKFREYIQQYCEVF
ncbi:glycosyltransferase family 4 protein [Paenibacillus sp. EPM92]|uniref:glycosyltransferase family 4 protein n=1 Tax=Paenibacillus sp. EPM92 TaxID=1561195 RepID=UPI00191660AD|nr:glycosyltransferase family 4 protein [Paenibacillus sp. EPM92]